MTGLPPLQFVLCLASSVQEENGRDDDQGDDSSGPHQQCQHVVPQQVLHADHQPGSLAPGRTQLDPQLAGDWAGLGGTLKFDHFSV